MRRLVFPLPVLAVVAAGILVSAQQAAVPAGARAVPPIEGEWRLRNVRQLTFGGENAEAYFSFDGRQLVFQATREGDECDQIYVMTVDGTGLRKISSGEGRTTCAYFLPGDREIIYSSTHLGGKACPPRPDFSRGYVWPIYPTYDIFKVRIDGTGLTRLTSTEGYDAEATVGPTGRIIFTSTRDGDMELYSMNADGSDVRRLTHSVGPDGGAFYSADGRMIVWRGKHLTDPAEREEYLSLLRDGLWRPTDLEVFVADADGRNVRQVTDLRGSSFAPFFHPDGKRIIFSSNHHDPKGRNFDLYLINVDGTGLERVTYNGTFDGFPMFSPDGTRLVFASNRYNEKPTDTNIFIADWVERP